MSADLFAEFTKNPSAPEPESLSTQALKPLSAQIESPWPQRRDPPENVGSQSFQVAPQPPYDLPAFPSRPAGSAIWTAPSPSAAPQDDANGDEEDWGDFEVADSAQISLEFQAHSTIDSAPATKSSSGATLISSIPNRPSLAEQRQPHSSELFHVSWAQPQQSPNPHFQSKPSDPNVLFDVDDFELSDAEAADDDGDEFGDFAAASKPSPRPQPAAASAQTPAPTFDLLGLDDFSSPPIAHISNEGSRKSIGALHFGATSTHVQSSKSPHQSQGLLHDLPTKNAKKGGLLMPEEDDGWGAWDDLSTVETQPQPGRSGGPQSTDNWDWDVVDSGKPSAPEPPDDGSPPINVPPPSVILSAFPSLFESGNSLFQPVAGQDTSMKKQILSDQKVAQFLKGYILLGTTAARIIAGRKHRWHRDKLLVKSMSISAAGSKGMKLAGMDKTQSLREDRECADVVTAWREHVGRLRAAVAIANANGNTNLKVPELCENMQTHTAKMVPTARGPCLICGLKREERIAKIDLDVEDSFGEWWVEHWGHRACKNFWLEHEKSLRQR